MYRQLALFPLQIIVFPGEAVNLHIFEPRYRQLITDCLEQGITFGIPSFVNGKVNEFGTEVKLINVEKTHSGGEMDIKTKALGIFRIKAFYPQLNEKLYAGGLVEDHAHEEEENKLTNEQILDQARDLFRMMNVKKKLPTSIADFTTYDIAHYVGFNPEQEYEFLTSFKALDRQQLLLEQIGRVIPILQEMDNLKKRAQLNGHFKNLIPPKF